MDYEDSSSESDEDDEMLAEIAAHARKPKTIRARPDNFHKWDEDEFFVRFRLSKITVLHLLQEIEHLISTRTEKNQAVSPMNRLLLALRFYALGTMLIAVGDFAGVHKSTACRIVRDVTRAIASLRPQYIRFPQSEAGLQELKVGFFGIASFPGVVGTIDCTHIKIQSPGGQKAEDFRNRKGYFSISVQSVSGPDLRFLDIVARWPGSAHDRTIYNNSTVKARFEMGEMGNGLLLGDSGYTLSSFLITPLRNPNNPEETLFNESQIRTRSSVERQYGVWKRRFPVLSLGIRLSLRRVQDVIIATAVLHNMACTMREGEPPRDPELPAELDMLEDQMPLIPAPAGAHGEGARRQDLINVYFRGLINGR